MNLNEMAHELRNAGWWVEPPVTMDTCPHTWAEGQGGMNSDGSGYYTWRCRRCGGRRHTTWEPMPIRRRDPQSR